MTTPSPRPVRCSAGKTLSFGAGRVSLFGEFFALVTKLAIGVKTLGTYIAIVSRVNREDIACFLESVTEIKFHSPRNSPERADIHSVAISISNAKNGNQAMKKTTLVAAAILTTVSSVALAQAADSNTGALPSQATTTNPKPNGSGLRQQLANSLQQSGFTNIKVVPDSFLVQANDKSGNPVTMFIGPNSATEFTTVGSSDQASDSNAATAGTQAGGMFTSLPAKDELSSKVVGLDVYNNANQNIGTIKDVAYNGSSVNGYILGVAGILGMGEHYVAVRPSAIKLSYEAKDKKWHASMDTNADQLKAAPEYKYPSNT
jgi:hypothetical protein